MNFDYLKDDTEKSLAPFFSPAMQSITFNCVWIIGLLLMVFWPHKELFKFIQTHKIPLAFLGTFVGVLLIISYVNLRCGRGEIYQKNIFSRMTREGLATFEEENSFFSYGLVQFILHTIFFILLVLPMLIYSATISGISLPLFAKSLSILFTAALLCRLFSFLMYLIFGRWSFIGHLFTRIFFILFFFATGAFAAFANPILLIYDFYRGEETLSLSSMSPYSFYIIVVLAAILLIAITNNAIIRRNIFKERSG